MDIGRHVCTWFDDGDGLDLLCACGARAVAGVEDADGERLVLVLADAPAHLAATA